jgi:hypothetical protein
MTKRALDGTEFTNQMGVNRHNARLKAQNYKAPAQADDADQQDQTQPDDPQSIENDPRAMQCIDELKQMGYTADDVAAAMGDDSDADTSDSGDAATQAAAIQLPGMR